MAEGHMSPPASPIAIPQAIRGMSRRNMLATTAGLSGFSLPAFLQLRAHATPISPAGGKAKACIIVYCWGGMSHFESFDPKPDAPVNVRGEFAPISTATPGIQISEHLPLLAQQTEKLAIIRSINHDDSAHGRGMYWNLTGHRPPRAGNIPPLPADWPSLPAMISPSSAPLIASATWPSIASIC